MTPVGHRLQIFTDSFASARRRVRKARCRSDPFILILLGKETLKSEIFQISCVWLAPSSGTQKYFYFVIGLAMK